MNAVCVACGRHGHAERHHVGGKLSTVLTDVCPPCHRLLSRWQSERGFDLRSGSSDVGESTGDRTPDPVLGVRIAVETLDLVRLTMMRSGAGEALVSVVEALTGLARSVYRWDQKPASYGAEIPVVAPEPEWEWERYNTWIELVTDAAHALAAEDVIPFNLNGDLIRRSAASQRVGRAVPRFAAALLVMTSESRYGITTLTDRPTLEVTTIADLYKLTRHQYLDSFPQ